MIEDIFGRMTKTEREFEIVEHGQLGDYEYLIRSTPMGTLNGYIGLPPWHPWNDMHYDEIPVDCHGGLSFADYWDEFGLEAYWVGFDCCHDWDIKPGLDKELGRSAHYPQGATYKDRDYVYNEILSMVEQARAAELVQKER